MVNKLVFGVLVFLLNGALILIPSFALAVDSINYTPNGDIISSNSLGWAVVSTELESRTIIVPDEFLTIQEAINSANNGDRIYIRRGIYQGNIEIRKTVQLVGESRNETIIDGNATGHVILVTSNDVRISNLTVQNSGYDSGYVGIFIVSSNNVTINNNNIVNNGYGIALHYADYTKISRNNISANHFNGIRLDGSSNNRIFRNNVVGNRFTGIFLYDKSSNNTIFENSVKENHQGIGLSLASSNNNVSRNNMVNNSEHGLWIVRSTNNMLRSNILINNNFFLHGEGPQQFINDVDSTNTIDGKPIYYIISKDDIKIPLDAACVVLVSCTNIRIENLTFVNQSRAITLSCTNHTIISGNTISDNSFGFWLFRSSFNIISGNDINNNKWAIYLWNSSDNRISSNMITENDVSLRLEGFSPNNLIYMNNITNNVYGPGLLSSNNSIFRNTIENNGRGVSLSERYNRAFENDIVNNDHGIYIGDSSRGNFVFRNNIRNNSKGIYCWHTENDHIFENIVKSNIYGIELYQSENISIFKNTLENNDDGIYLLASSGNSIFRNDIIDDRCGISFNTFHVPKYTAPSENNSVRLNNFINNSINIVNDRIWSIQIWDNGCEGNYWSDYNGSDSDGDGIGDSPYIIDEYNQDNHPLMNPQNLIFSDMNYDFIIDMRDIGMAAWSIGSFPTHPRWNVEADVDQNGSVDIKDLILIARNFGETYPISISININFTRFP